MCGHISILIFAIIGIVVLGSFFSADVFAENEEEKINLRLAERQNADYRLLSGILMGFGFLLVLVSFGARRKRKGGAKKIEKKPSV